MNNPNNSISLTRSGSLRAMELAYLLKLEDQAEFADELVKEFEAMSSAYGDNISLDSEVVQRVFERIEK